MLLSDGALRSRVLPFLTVRELIKLRQVCRDLRQWVRSPSIEKRSMIRCLKQCYGLYDVAYRADSQRWRCHHPPEVLTWVDLEMILSLEADQVESEYLDDLTLGTIVFKRLSLPDSKEIKLLLKYLNIDWVRGDATPHSRMVSHLTWFERCELYKLGREASPKEVQSMIKSIERVIPEITLQDVYHANPLFKFVTMFSREGKAHYRRPGAASVRHSHVNHATEGFTATMKRAPNDHWTQRVELPADSLDCTGPQVPREAAVPFYLRVALEDAALLKRLLDVEDQAMTPTRFLRRYGALKLVTGTYHERRPAGTALGSIAQFLITSLLENSRIFELSPDEFWTIGTPIGKSDKLSTSKLSEWLINSEAEDDWWWWDHCCTCLSNHYRFYRSQMMSLIMRHPTAASFDASKGRGLGEEQRFLIKREGHGSLWIFLGSIVQEGSLFRRHNETYLLFLTSQGLVIWCAVAPSQWPDVPCQGSDYSDSESYGLSECLSIYYPSEDSE